jgi:MOSC domain-containing protein YiiM
VEDIDVTLRQTTAMQHFELETLEQGLDDVRRSPKDAGRVELIVRRPAVEEREVVAEAALDPEEGLVGDCWKDRGSRAMADGSAHPDMQLTLMNARAVSLVAGERDRWPLAGDQLFVDLDLSESNLPPGTRIEVGTAVIEITAAPHTGCGKFSKRFGNDAMKFVNSKAGRELKLRGIYAKIVSAGSIQTGDELRKVPAAA